MLIRVLSRGLFFRRESQVDIPSRPLGDRKINVEDIKVVHSLASNVTGVPSLDDGSHNESETSSQQPARVTRTEGHDVENYPALPGAVPGGLCGARQALDYPSNVHKPSSESGDSYAFGHTTAVAMNPEDDADDADEIFQTPLHQTPFLGHSEDGVSPKQRFASIEHFEDPASCTGLPDMPTVESQPTQGMLSDITEADEAGAQDLSTQSLKLSPNLLRVRAMSFSSFGSSYPSSCFGSPSLNNPPTDGITATCSVTSCPEASTSVSSPANDGFVQSLGQSAPREVPGPGLSTPASSTSDFVPFVVEPLLSSDSVHQQGESQDVGDEHKDGHEAKAQPMPTVATTVVPSASTYADATNLALQHPDMASDILRRPLSSASGSACPSKFPTPSVSRSVSLQVIPPASASCTPVRAGTPHTAERPNWALAPDVPAPARPASAAALKAHTAESPNWALAKDEPKSPADRRSRSRSRARGRSSTRPASSTRGAEHWVRGDARIPDADQAEPARQTVPTSAVVSPKQKPECDDVLPAVPSQAANLEDGPHQWLNRVNTWVEQTSRGPKTCPGTPDRDAEGQGEMTSSSSSEEPSIRPQHHSRTASGLNPHAPVWTPAPRARCQTPSDSDSAPPATQSESSPSSGSVRGPFTFGVDADIDRLRDMLRNCGIQDKEASVPSISSDGTTTSGSTPPRPEETEGVLSSDEESQKASGAFGKTRAVSKTPGRVDPRGAARPQPQANVPQKGFEFTVPTRLGPAFSLAGPMSGRTTSIPQNLFSTPPRFAFRRANAQPFRKEFGGPWTGGHLDPGPSAPSSGPSSLPGPSSGLASFSFSGSAAAGPSRLSFSQASHSFSRTCQPEPGSSNVQATPSPFLPGSYKVRVNCTEKGPEAPVPVPASVPTPVPRAPASPFTAGVKRPRQPTIGPLTFKSQRFA